MKPIIFFCVLIALMLWIAFTINSYNTEFGTNHDQATYMNQVQHQQILPDTPPKALKLLPLSGSTKPRVVVRVREAGQTDYNGVYREYGVYNGHPVYRKDEGHWLCYERMADSKTNQWVLTDQPTCGTIAYTTRDRDANWAWTSDDAADNTTIVEWKWEKPLDK